MAKQNKVVSVLSTSAISGLVASALMTSQAFAAVDAYTVKVGGDVYQYSKTELMESYLDSTEGTKAPLFEDFQAKMTEGKGVFAYHDDKSGYVTAQSVFDKYLENEAKFNLDEFTASKDAKVVEVPTVKKAVVKDGEVKFEDQSNDDQKTDVKVESVSAINAAQIKVTFNKTLTDSVRDEVEDLDNYTLNNSKGDEIEDVFADVDVKEGSNEAILTVNHDKIGSDDDEYENQNSYELVFDENITGKEVSKTFKVSDYDIPEVQSVEVVGIKTIKVKLSEPVVAKKDKKLADAFEINNEDYSIDKVVSINNGTELNIELYSDLKDGEELKVDVKSEAEDYAGYALKKASFKSKVNFDKSDLKIESYRKAKDREITLVFNKDVKFCDYEDDTKLATNAADDTEFKDFKQIGDNDDVIESFYHTTSKNKVEAVKIDGNEVTLYFGDDYQLPETAYIFVDADTLEDLWEKKNNDLNVKVNVTKDNDRPEIKKLEQDEDSNRKIIITFNEDIDKESAEDRANYTVKGKDGKEVRISDAIKTDDDEVTLTVSKDLEDGDKYEVTVEDVEDKAGNKISKVTKSFTAKETEAVDEVTVRCYDPSKSSQKIVVDFDKTKMLADGSRYAINNLENYDLYVDGVKVNLEDYDGASIKAVEDGKKAEIKLPGNISENNKDDKFNFKLAKEITLTINKVEDANENRTDVKSGIKVLGEGEIGLDDAKQSPIAVDTENIKVVLEDEIDFKNGDMSIGYYTVNDKNDKVWNKIEPGSTKVEKKNGITTITYKLKEEDQLAYNGQYKGKYDIIVKTKKATDDDKMESENRYGDKLASNQEWLVMDEIAPALALINSKDNAPQTVKFSPDIKLDDRDDYDDAVKVVSYDTTNHRAVVQLTFEEELTNANINKHTFNTDDDDVDVFDAVLSEDNHKVIVITLDATDAKDDYKEIKDFLGLGITTKTNEVFDKAENSPNGVNGGKVDTEIEAVDETADPAKGAKAEVAKITKDLTFEVADADKAGAAKVTAAAVAAAQTKVANGYTVTAKAEGTIKDNKLAVAFVVKGAGDLNKAETSALELAFTVKAPAAVSAPALVGASAADAETKANDGKTLLTLPASPVGATKFVYKIEATGTAVATPKVGDDLSSWTAMPVDKLIATTNDFNIGVAAVTADGKAVQFTNVKAVVKAHVEATAAVKTADADLGASVAFDTATKIVINDTDVTLTNIKALAGTYDAATNIDTVVTELQKDINATALNGQYTVAKSGNKLTITSVATGAAAKVDLTKSDVATGATLLGFTTLGAVNGADAAN